jgi:hypothetical protein
MAVFQSIFRRRKKFKRKYKYLCIVFPEPYGELCDFIAERIGRKFLISCISIKYNRVGRQAIEQIESFLDHSCILIIGYTGELTSENFYKIGMAHARKGLVGLVDLCPTNEVSERFIKGDPICREIPGFARYQYYGCFSEEAWTNFIGGMEQFVAAVIGNDLDRVLYQKALEACKRLEGSSMCFIEKRSEKEFLLYLRNERNSPQINYSHDILYSPYEDDDTLRSKLLYLIAKKELQVVAALSRNSMENSKTLKEFNQIVKNFYFVEGDQINQYGSRDNFAGDQVKGDKFNRR